MRFWLRWSRLKKRSQALRGRNLAREIQACGAPRAHQAPVGRRRQGPFFWVCWDTGVIPQKSSRRSRLPAKTLRQRTHFRDEPECGSHRATGEGNGIEGDLADWRRLRRERRFEKGDKENRTEDDWRMTMASLLAFATGCVLSRWRAIWLAKRPPQAPPS